MRKRYKGRSPYRESVCKDPTLLLVCFLFGDGALLYELQ
jgi:hypothetical protein